MKNYKIKRAQLKSILIINSRVATIKYLETFEELKEVGVAIVIFAFGISVYFLNVFIKTKYLII